MYDAKKGDVTLESLPHTGPPVYNHLAVPPPNTGDQEDFYGFEEDWFYSAAPVRGIRSIRTCSDKSREDGPTIGVMLYFDNDRRECLGQWRGDAVISEKHDFPCFPMVRRYRYSNHRSPALQVIVRKEHELREQAFEDDFGDFPISGELVWWFGPYGNVLELLQS